MITTKWERGWGREKDNLAGETREQISSKVEMGVSSSGISKGQPETKIAGRVSMSIKQSLGRSGTKQKQGAKGEVSYEILWSCIGF